MSREKNKRGCFSSVFSSSSEDQRRKIVPRNFYSVCFDMVQVTSPPRPIKVGTKNTNVFDATKSLANSTGWWNNTTALPFDPFTFNTNGVKAENSVYKKKKTVDLDECFLSFFHVAQLLPRLSSKRDGHRELKRAIFLVRCAQQFQFRVITITVE